MQFIFHLEKDLKQIINARLKYEYVFGYVFAVRVSIINLCTENCGRILDIFYRVI